MTTGWTSAPERQVLLPGCCVERDADGQQCAAFDHYPSPHQSTGLRTWLETTGERALIRCYDASRADELEAMEGPLFARFGFAPIAQQDLVRTEYGGISLGWALVVGPM